MPIVQPGPPLQRPAHQVRDDFPAGLPRGGIPPLNEFVVDHLMHKDPIFVIGHQHLESVQLG
jgi:hypothetical protein